MASDPYPPKPPNIACGNQAALKIVSADSIFLKLFLPRWFRSKTHSAGVTWITLIPPPKILAAISSHGVWIEGILPPCGGRPLTIQTSMPTATEPSSLSELIEAAQTGQDAATAARPSPTLSRLRGAPAADTTSY